MAGVLVVVDMQKDFVYGALGTKEAERIVPGVAARIDRARAQGHAVLATVDTHGPQYLQTREGRMLPVPHCLRGTEGWQLADGIAQRVAQDERLEKDGFTALALPDRVRQALDRQGWDGLHADIALCGLCTDICVVSNALLLRAHFPEAAITVDGDLCAGVTPGNHQAALQVMQSCQIRIAREG